MSDEQDTRLREALRGLAAAAARRGGPRAGPRRRRGGRGGSGRRHSDHGGRRGTAALRGSGTRSRSSPATAGWRSGSRPSRWSPSSQASCWSALREAAGRSPSAPAMSCSALYARCPQAARSPPRSSSRHRRAQAGHPRPDYDVDRYRLWLQADGSYRLTAPRSRPASSGCRGRLPPARRRRLRREHGSAHHVLPRPGGSSSTQATRPARPTAGQASSRSTISARPGGLSGPRGARPISASTNADRPGSSPARCTRGPLARRSPTRGPIRDHDRQGDRLPRLLQGVLGRRHDARGPLPRRARQRATAGRRLRAECPHRGLGEARPGRLPPHDGRRDRGAPRVHDAGTGERTARLSLTQAAAARAAVTANRLVRGRTSWRCSTLAASTA